MYMWWLPGILINTSFLVIRWDTQFLIGPLGGVRPREVTQDCVRVVPAMPKYPKPHGTADQLRLKFLFLGYLWILSVLRLNMRSITSISLSHSLRTSSKELWTSPYDSYRPSQIRHIRSEQNVVFRVNFVERLSDEMSPSPLSIKRLTRTATPIGQSLKGVYVLLRWLAEFASLFCPCRSTCVITRTLHQH